ncbi:MAG: protein translocase SEC61 complex subunit gamma [Candidatus Aenigmarchaeota archaeon]|nr:protein translocase SEC61 complex subunit gamma [Candidatus Aenigmarchaeota archaeon]
MNLKDMIRNWKRVLHIARKPNKEEFMSTSKICALGLVLIGAIGFAIFIASIISCSVGGFCL